jgi:hypothetical protein
MARHHALDETVFDELTPEACYWAGFIFTDGCLTEKPKLQGENPKISLNLIDKEHVVKWASFVKSSHKIGISKPHTKLWGDKLYTSKEQARISFNSTRLFNRFKELGWSKDGSSPIQELKDSRDFWRGVVDGDGSIGIYERTRGGQKRPHISLTSDRTLLDGFDDYIKSLVPENKATVRPKSCIFQIHLNSSHARIVIDGLYRDATVYLDRKYAKAMEIINGNTPN